MFLTNTIQCSASCGSGEVIRNVTCVDSANTSLVLDSELCTTEAMPSQMETCIQSSCTKWITGDWKPVGILRFYPTPAGLCFYMIWSLDSLVFLSFASDVEAHRLSNVITLIGTNILSTV